VKPGAAAAASHIGSRVIVKNISSKTDLTFPPASAASAWALALKSELKPLGHLLTSLPDKRMTQIPPEECAKRLAALTIARITVRFPYHLGPFKSWLLGSTTQIVAGAGRR
jgi:hypothetical protein